MKKTILASAILSVFGTCSYAATSIHVNFSPDDYLHGETVTSSNYEKFVVTKNQTGSFGIGGDTTKAVQIETNEAIAMFFRNAATGGDISNQTEASREANGGITLEETGLAGGIVANIVAIDLIKLKGTSEGIRIQGQAPSSAGASSIVNLKADNVYIEGKDSAIVAYSGAQLNIDAKNIHLISEKDAITTRGDAVTTVRGDSVKMVGNVNFDFDKLTSNTSVDAKVTMDLKGKESYWVGNTVVSWADKDENVDEGKLAVEKGVDLSLSEGASWTPTKTTNDSTTQQDGSKYTVLNNLNLSEGVVNITGEEIEVTVKNMKGTGTVNLATDGTTAGKFNVTEVESDTSLDVNLMDSKMEKELTADEINAEQAEKLLGNVGKNDAGESVVKTSTSVKEGMVNNAFGVDSDGNVKTASVNTLMQSSLELATAAPLALNRIMMNDVRKRLGDIRTSNGTHGAWARYDGGRLSGEGDLENDFNTIQVGFDTMPSDNAPRVGVAFSYTDSDSEYARGSADMKAYSLAAYGTWMSEDGMFFDLIGRMGTADTDMVVDGQHKGSMNNMALSLSGEFGWRFDVTDSIYVEPQVEATYTFINGDNLSLSTANYDVDDVHSLLGRIGFAAGLKCPNERGNVYVRASAVHEFLGDSEIAGVNGASRAVYEIDGKDTWVEYGIGANFNITQSTYMWADVERTSGGTLDEDWRATVGVRYSW